MTSSSTNINQTMTLTSNHHPNLLKPPAHTITYQAFLEITNFIRDNGDDWDEFCHSTARSARKIETPLPL
jgi:hypothetical protein